LALPAGTVGMSVQFVAVLVFINAPGNNQAQLRVSGLTIGTGVQTDLWIAQVNGGIIS